MASSSSRRSRKTKNNDDATVVNKVTSDSGQYSSSSSVDNQLKQVVQSTKRLKICENVDDAASLESSTSQNIVPSQPQSSFTNFVAPSQIQIQTNFSDQSSRNSSFLNSSINSSFRSDVSSVPQSEFSFISAVDEEMEENPTNINIILSQDILCKIFNYLPNIDFVKCKSVCKKWKEMISSKFNILRILIILRDINRGEEDSKLKGDRLMITNQLHTVQVTTLSSGSNPFVHQMTLADIFSNLSQRRPTFRHMVTAQRRLISTNPNSSKINQNSKFPSKYDRTNVWIYGVNLQVDHKEIEPLFRNYQHVISHLSLIETRETREKNISASQLFQTLHFLKETLEFLELSIFPRVSDATNNNNHLDFFPLNKLRVLKFSSPFNWMNTEQSAKIIRELLRMSQNLTEIQNFPFLLNLKQPVQNPVMDGQSTSRVQVDLGSSVTSMYFNAHHVLFDVKDEDEGMTKDDFINEQMENYTDPDTKICPSFTFMKIDPNYNSIECVQAFNKFLRSSKQTMTTLEIPPLLSFSHSIYIPMLPNLKKFIFTDVFHSELPFFPVDGEKDPNFGYKNLNSVQLNLDNLSPDSLQNYFPPGIFLKKTLDKYFKTVTNLKIYCTFNEDPADSFEILSDLFPKVLKLELKPMKGAKGNYLKAVLPRLPEFWPNLTHLTLNICDFVQLRDIPVLFVSFTIPNRLRALVSLKFRFPVDIPATSGSQADWIEQLGKFLSKKLLPNLTVYVLCGWRLGRLSLERVSKYFEIMNPVVHRNF